MWWSTRCPTPASRASQAAWRRGEMAERGRDLVFFLDVGRLDRQQIGAGRLGHQVVHPPRVADEDQPQSLGFLAEHVVRLNRPAVGQRHCLAVHQVAADRPRRNAQRLGALRAGRGAAASLRSCSRTPRYAGARPGRRAAGTGHRPAAHPRRWRGRRCGYWPRPRRTPPASARARDPTPPRRPRSPSPRWLPTGRRWTPARPAPGCDPGDRASAGCGPAA